MNLAAPFFEGMYPALVMLAISMEMWGLRCTIGSI